MTRNRSWSRGQFALRLNNAGAEFAEIYLSTAIVDDHHSAQNWKSFNSIIRAQLTVRVHLQVTQVDIGDFNRTQFTELNLVRNSKTSSRYAVRTNSTLRPFLTVWVLRSDFTLFFLRSQFSVADPYGPMIQLLGCYITV